MNKEQLQSFLETELFGFKNKSDNYVIDSTNEIYQRLQKDHLLDLINEQNKAKDKESAKKVLAKSILLGNSAMHSIDDMQTSINYYCEKYTVETMKNISFIQLYTILTFETYISDVYDALKYIQSKFQKFSGKSGTFINNEDALAPIYTYEDIFYEFTLLRFALSVYLD